MNGTLVERLLLNVVLAGFNLLPAFPMDAGRVLRALPATRVEYTRATNLAASIGQAMAILFGFVGLLGNPVLLFIALFVWIGAAQEATSVQMKSALAGIPVRRAMLTHYRTLTLESTLQDAVDLMLTGSQQDFPVVRDGIVDGLLTRGDLVAALAKDGRGAAVADVMRRRFDVAHPGDMLEAALAGLQTSGCQTLPVTHNGRLVGLVTTDNIGELVMIHAADRAAVRAGAS